MRTVSAWITSEEHFCGVVGPFPVDVPWWAEAGPVVAYLEQVLGVRVWVLRLLSVEGGEGARDGHVTYHVEAAQRPEPGGVLADGPVDLDLLKRDNPLRVPWARAQGLREALDWASATLETAGRTVTGPAEQRKTWNLAGLFRFPTASGPVWLKTLPHFAADEAAAIAVLAEADPGLVPTVIGAGPGRMLLEHLPGEDCWDADAELVIDMVERFVAAQAALSRRPLPELRDLRAPTIAARARELVDGLRDLTPDEAAAALTVIDRWPLLEECGLPDTLVHGDFHPGNWRADGGSPVALDFADVHLGNPVLDGLRICGFVPRDRRDAVARAWVRAWKRHAPHADPERALTIGEPLAHLTNAVRYQEFLDGIEPSERIYHHGDPAAAVRAALRATT